MESAADRILNTSSVLSGLRRCCVPWRRTTLLFSGRTGQPSTTIQRSARLLSIRRSTISASDPLWLPFLREHGMAPEQLAAIKFDVKVPS